MFIPYLSTIIKFAILILNSSRVLKLDEKLRDLGGYSNKTENHGKIKTEIYA